MGIRNLSFGPQRRADPATAARRAPREVVPEHVTLNVAAELALSRPGGTQGRRPLQWHRHPDEDTATLRSISLIG
ncbi:MAG: hypothetical protein K0S14_1334 [Thermomicrobiales bacterium]|nr:hypothetical protein [Thermomicrobiales bacterium]